MVPPISSRPSWPRAQSRDFAGRCIQHHALRWSNVAGNAPGNLENHGKNMGKPWENPWTSSVNMSNVDLPCDSFLEGIWEAERPKGHTWLERLEADTSISGSKGRRKTKNSGFYICLAKPTSWYSSQKRSPWNRTVMSIISSPHGLSDDFTSKCVYLVLIHILWHM